MAVETGPGQPPRLWRWLLAWTVPASERAATLGELYELWRERVARAGRWRAGWWYRRQVGGFVARRWRIRRLDRDEGSGEERMGRWSDWTRDLAWSFRAMGRRPGHTTVVVATLALGVGATSAVLALADAHFFAPLPYGTPHELVLIWETSRGSSEVTTVAPGNYHTWREEASSFRDVAAFNVDAATLSGGDGAEEVAASVVVPHFFDVLGVQPALGSGFTEEAVRAADGRLVLLSHGLWTRRYGADPAVVGSDIRVDGHPHTVVGVLPPEYRQPERRLAWQGTELWRPMLLDGQRDDHDSRYLRTVARLRPGVTLARAREEMDAMARRMAQAFPEANRGRSIQVWTLPDYLMQESRPVLLVLLAAGAAVLLLVCANVANLTLARGEERRREFAVRAALGSGAGRLLRQVLVEGAVLALAGGVVGLTGVFLGRNFLQLAQERWFTGLVAASVDLRVVLATLGLALAAGLASNLPLARMAARSDLRGALVEGGTRGGGGAGQGTTRSLLIVGQVAIATALVVVAALLVRSFEALTAVEPGFEPRGLLTLPVPAPSARYPDRASVEGFYRELWRELEAQPGVEAVSLVSDLPFTGENRWTEARVDGVPWDPESPPRSEYRIAFPDHFRVMGIPVERGELPADGWTGGDPVPVVVNRRLAEAWWPGQDALGRTFTLEWSDTVHVAVAAVVGDVRDDGFDGGLDPLFYLPWGANPTRSMHAMLRVRGDPQEALASIRAAVARLDPEVPVADLRSLRELMSETVARPRAASVLGGVFALVALLVAAAGIYGVLSFTVQSRTREMGIRTALGASSGALVSMVMGQSGRLVALGLVLGIAGALAAGSALSGVLFGVPAWDPVSLAAAVVLLGGVAVLASWLPARRATRVDPRSALSRE